MHSFSLAYILLWFPLSSETFVFREVVQLAQKGLPLQVYTIYGKALHGCSKEMHDYSGPLTRLGLGACLSVALAFMRALLRQPGTVGTLLAEGLFRRMRCWETLGENTLCFFAAFRLAELFREQGVELIVTPWANGPGTAAWIASRLTGIPFVLTGRAGDIYPPDGVLAEKLRDAALVRVNNAATVPYLKSQCPPDLADKDNKIRLVYNSLTLAARAQSAVPMQPPYCLLAVGRLVRTKGFDVLLDAVALLAAAGFPCRVTVAGDGKWCDFLHRQAQALGIEDMLDWRGFVPHDDLLELLLSHDMLLVPSVVDKSGDRDGIPNVIMEALNSGLPVIATRVNGIAEVVHHEQTGLLIPERDAAALAQAVQRMAGDRAWALGMAQAGKALVKDMFAASANIERLAALYAEAQQKVSRSDKVSQTSPHSES